MHSDVKEIEKFRAQIDLIDQAILELISRRHSIAGLIGEVKRSCNLEVQNKEREKEIVSRLVRKAAKLNLDEKLVLDVWSSIMSESRKIQLREASGNGK